MGKTTSTIHCSVCREPGHTKRTCRAIKRNDAAGVFVRVMHSGTPSPHVVALKKSYSTDHWHETEVYKPDQGRGDHAVIDLAAIVHAANTTDDVVASPPEEKKVNAPPIPNHFKEYHIEFESQIPMRERFKTIRAFVTSRATLIGIAVFVLLVALPVPTIAYYQTLKDDTQKVIEASTHAFLSLQSSTVAALASNIPQAQYDLNEALMSFTTAQSILDKEHKALLYVVRLLPIVGTRIASRQQLLLAGHHLALGNTYLVKGIGEAIEPKDMDMIERLTLMRDHVKSAVPQYEEARKNLEKVQPEALPVEYQGPFTEFKTLFAAFVDDLGDIAHVMDALTSILGSDGLKRYLIVFQNDHELRPTGGFIGSMAIVDVQRGKIMNIDLPGGGSYDLQGQLDVLVKPPVPLQMANPRWEFQDGNWFPDFPASAEKLEWFYEHSRNSTVDGVIAVNASVLERVLRILGPVYTKDFDLLLNPDDALDKLQYQVEEGYDKSENKPKAVLASVLDQLLASVQQIQPERLMAMANELNDAFNQKEIQVYFNDTNDQAKLRAFGWTGEILPTSGAQDYVYVVNTNVGGEKSDARITERIQHQAVVSEDGTVTDTVTITRTHTGETSEQFYGTANIDYLRLYVPKGSRLIAAGGFAFPEEESFTVPIESAVLDSDLTSIEHEDMVDEKTGTRVTREFGKTAFGNWVSTRPGETTEVFFTYELPFRVFGSGAKDSALSRYELVTQKQSGVTSEFTQATIYPPSWRPAWRLLDDSELTLNGALTHIELTEDTTLGLVMQKGN